MGILYDVLIIYIKNTSKKIIQRILIGYWFIFLFFKSIIKWLSRLLIKKSDPNIMTLPPKEHTTTNWSTYIRCIHNKNLDDKFDELLLAYNSSQEYLNSNERITLGSTHKSINLNKCKITVNIPMVFHLLDPKLSVYNYNIDFWTDHINDNIISQLNKDFNVSYDNLNLQYTKYVNNLFINADPSKKDFYLKLVSALPYKLNLEWIFSLHKIIINPVDNLNISTGQNEKIYKSALLEDPEKFLNIIVSPGTKILGISVFPFIDRDITNIHQIDKTLKYRNAIIINTSIFEGTIPQFNKFRTFTHEIGHWCGLLHPFDNITYKTVNLINFGLDKLEFNIGCIAQNDINKYFINNSDINFITQSQPTYGTVYDNVTIITKEINNTIQTIKIRNTPYAYIFEKNDQTPNFFNFMDYTDDSQMCMFTQLQVLHMIYMLSRFRPNFIEQVSLDDK